MSFEQIYFSSTIYALAAIGYAIFSLSTTLPKIWREARVKNGLRNLRKYMLITAGSIYVLCILSFIMLSLRFFLSAEVIRPFGWILLCMFATIPPIYAIFKRKIYDTQYSPEQKALHARYAKSEEARDKRLAATAKQNRKKRVAK